MTDDPRARDTYQQEENEMNESEATEETEAPEGQPTYPMQWTELAVTNRGEKLILEAGNGELMIVSSSGRVRFHPDLMFPSRPLVVTEGEEGRGSMTTAVRKLAEVAETSPDQDGARYVVRLKRSSEDKRPIVVVESSKREWVKFLAAMHNKGTIDLETEGASGLGD